MTTSYESTVDWLQGKREGGDYLRLRIGCRVARVETTYGAGVIKRLEIDANMGQTTLYEYRKVWLFLWRWRGFSARRIFDDFPELTYTHLRDALRGGRDFEDVIDCLLAVGGGDPAYPHYDLPMTPETFRAYLGEREGKAAPASPLFDEQGEGLQVWNLIKGRLPEWQGKRLRVIVKEVE